MNPLTASTVSRPATLDIRSAAASRNELHTDIAASTTPVVVEGVYIEDAIEARTPLVSLKQGDYRRDIFPRDVIGGGR